MTEETVTERALRLARQKVRERGLTDFSAPVKAHPSEPTWAAELLLPDLGSSLSEGAQRLEELYASVSIWETYRRLLPNHQHKPYRADADFNVQCPTYPDGSRGLQSLSDWMHDGKGFIFCGHDWEGTNKIGLYCKVRNIFNQPEFFHQIKRMFVWEFRGEDPYRELK